MSIFRVALSEDLEKLEGLLKDEGNINARNRAGETVLDVALSRKKKKAAALIKQYGGLSHIELAQKLGEELPSPSIVNTLASQRRNAAGKMKKTADDVQLNSTTNAEIAELRALRPAHAELRDTINREIASLHFQISHLASKLQKQQDAVSALRYSQPSHTAQSSETFSHKNRFAGTTGMDPDLNTWGMGEKKDNVIEGEKIENDEVATRHVDLTEFTDSSVEKSADRIVPATPKNIIVKDSEIPTPRDPQAYEKYTEQNWREIRDDILPDMPNDILYSAKRAFRTLVTDYNSHLSIFQVLWLLNVPLLPCVKEEPKACFSFLRRFVTVHPNVSFWEYVELVIQVILVSLVQLVIPYLLVHAMVMENHVDDNIENDGDDINTALSFCPAQSEGRPHHPLENEFTCVILMLYLIGNVLTSAPRSRLLCLQYATAENTAKDSIVGRRWLVIGFVVTTLMQVMCTAATYVLFIEYADMADLLLNAVALVFVLEADTMMSKIFLSQHLIQAGQVHDDKHYWMEHARGTKKWAKFGILASQGTFAELRNMFAGKLGQTHTVYLIFYSINLAWQFSIGIMMPVCY